MPLGQAVMSKNKLVENIKRVRERIEAACARVGRHPEDVTLVAVTKTVPLDVIHQALEAGLVDLGENRVQQLTERASMLEEDLASQRARQPQQPVPTPRWHMIGHLQRNKVKAVLPWVTLIHSVDSLRLAEEINTQAGRLGRKANVLMQVNVSGEKSKFGLAVGAATHMAEQLVSMENLNLLGLMTMAPLVDQAEKTRPWFARLRELLEEMQAERIVPPRCVHLSMGMSQDFEVAIEEGATIVRIGTALFEG